MQNVWKTTKTQDKLSKICVKMGNFGRQIMQNCM